MTRSEARTIAEELYKLMHKDIKNIVGTIVHHENDTYLNTQEAAEFLGVSPSFITQNLSQIPHSKVGKLNKFSKAALTAYINR